MKCEEPPRRHRILRTAERLFLHYGAAKTTIADIARATGIGVGSVYLDFPSKEAILKELAEEKVKGVADRMRARVAAAGVSHTSRLTAALCGRVEALLDFSRDGQHACDLVRCNAAGATEVQKLAAIELSSGFGSEPRAVVLELLVSGARAGELVFDDAELTLETLEIAFACLSPPSLYRIERSVAEARAVRLSRLVVFGISKRP